MGQQAQGQAAADRPGGEVRFGRTAVAAVVGDLFAQPVAAVVLAANRRGVLGTGARRALAGSAVEREVMAAAPLEMGSVFVSDVEGAGHDPLRRVLHAVIHPRLGEPADPNAVRRAVVVAFAAAERLRLASVALPILGVEASETPEGEAAVGVLVDEVVGCLRRESVQPERVLLVARDADAAQVVERAIVRARDRRWPERR